MKPENSRVAVVMASYNAEATLLESVASALVSTVPVHLFIVDDASRRPVANMILEKMGEIPANVTIMRTKVNFGPAGARSLAMRRIVKEEYRYAAILDADDFSHPERFAKQAAFLDTNPNVAAVGTWGNALDDKTLAIVSTESYPPTSPTDIRHALCINNCIINTSVMFRVSVLVDVGLWDESLYTGEDYDLFCRLARRHELANIPEYLVAYRLSRGGISLSGIGAQRRARLWIQMRHLPYRFYYWQAWAGLIRSALRVLVPTSWVDGFKHVTNRRRVF